MNSDTFKHFAGLLVLSVFVIVLANFWGKLFSTVYHSYLWLDTELADVFNNGPTGSLIRRSLTITIFPLLVAGVPAAIYWVMKRQLMPYFYHVVWFFWIVLLTISLIKY